MSDPFNLTLANPNGLMVEIRQDGTIRWKDGKRDLAAMRKWVDDAAPPFRAIGAFLLRVETEREFDGVPVVAIP